MGYTGAGRPGRRRYEPDTVSHTSVNCVHSRQQPGSNTGSLRWVVAGLNLILSVSIFDAQVRVRAEREHGGRVGADRDQRGCECH